jgi:hypothetical protein
MVKGTIDKFEELLNSPKSLSIHEFEQYIMDYIDRKADRKEALEELDRLIGIVQNHILSLSLFLKQNHLLIKQNFLVEDNDVEFYTKQEVAARYRVSVRTVTNWIIDGLETVEIGGVKRISNTALLAFTKIKRTKKFHWKSISR